MSDVLGIEPDRHNYIEEYAKDAVPTQVRVGSAEKFVPNINITRAAWADEAWLNIRALDTVRNEKETFDGEKVELTIGDKRHVYYNKNGHLEHEIIFASKPASNIIPFELSFPAGMRFLYQGTLREDFEFDDALNAGKPGRIDWETYQLAAHRPDNVIGSYAIYWPKTDNKYQTGKLCHIYRPLITDSIGQWAWCELFIDGFDMYITIPAKFLDEAVYPATLGPELGYSTAGSSNWGYASIVDGVINQVDGTGGNVDYFYIWLEGVQSGNLGVKQAVYNAPSSGIDVGGYALVEQIARDGSASGNNQYAGAGSALAADGHYCIAHSVQHNNNDPYYDTDGASRSTYYTGRDYVTEMVDPCGNMNNSATRKFSEWIDYSPGGGGISIPVVQHHRQQQGAN